MTIPPQVHFCWIGSSLPWAYVFAILSAAERSGLPTIILHHTDALKEGAELNALQSASHVCLSHIDPSACLTQVGEMLGFGGALAALYWSLESLVMRTDILRVAILYQQGGIYLDLDTITIAPLLPFLHGPQFVGSELIVWPKTVRVSRSPTVWAHHLALDLLRKMLRRMPYGWKTFRRVEGLYFRGFNNAVMGAEAKSRLFFDYLHAMLAVSADCRTQTYALGPDLLQEVVSRYQYDDLTIQAPQAFYPMPPEISEHWFRAYRSVQLTDVLSAETHVVHWYASVHGKQNVARIDPDYILQHKDKQLYSMLVYESISNFLELM